MTDSKKIQLVISCFGHMLNGLFEKLVNSHWLRLKMFLKAYKSKSHTLLSSSQKRQFRQRLEKSFPDATAEDLQILVSSKSNITQIKLLTATNVQTNVFCIDKLPMFFEVEMEGNEVLVPTLYSLWLLPTLLPYFTTHPDVLPRLSNGADLMLPGVIPNGTGMNKYGRYKKGQLIAVNLTSNLSAVGIGTLVRSSDDLFMCGGQGSAVKMLHLFGDKLWGHEPTLIQQVPNKAPQLPTSEDFPALGEEPKKNKEQQKVILETKTITNESTVEVEDDIDTITDCNGAGNEEIETETIISPEIVLKNAFLASLKNKGKSLQLPLLTSNFFRLYVLPEASQSIDIKKTKYKKLSTFLNEMANEGFLVVREETKGVDKIISINFEHEELLNFITDFKPPSLSNNENDNPTQPLFHSELKELYIVTDITAPLFTRMDFKRGEGIPTTQIKKIIRDYTYKQDLKPNATTKSLKLDETLQKICGCTEATLNEISSSVIQKMEHSFQMCSIKDVSSNKPLIQMSLATRSGNKKVTLVSNLECYGIVLPEFIKLCKQGAAASTTIVKLPNQKREQLQIQGNQVRFIFNLLTETYKVPPKNILGLELAKDGKKHKKK